MLEVICKECGKAFVVSDKEQEWLKEQCFKMFKRCRDCRKKRREQNNGK